MPCPDGYKWYVKAKKCYLSQVIDSVPGSAVVNTCRDLHARATPVEPRNQAQMDIIQTLAGTS